MAAIDFPTNPVPGQEFSTLETVYVWNGTGWRTKSTIGGGGGGGEPGDYLPLSGGSLTGDLALQYSDPVIHLNKSAAANANKIKAYSGLMLRWDIVLGEAGAEAGSNAGSPFVINSYNDAGNIIGEVLRIERSERRLLLAGAPTAPNHAATKGYVDSATAVGFPTGTKMVFYMAAPPVGWTIDVTNNDSMMRVVNSTGGGSANTGSMAAFFNRTATDPFTNTTYTMPVHQHPLNVYQGLGDTNANGYRAGQARDPAISTGYVVAFNASGQDLFPIVAAGGSNPHSHGLDTKVKYIDVIICVKT